MENDQIKSQIENAKKAFIAGKERSREVISSELDTGNEKVQKDMVPEDRQLQEDIMSRVRGLMDEATQTSKGVTKDPFIARQPAAESRAKPFWAQNRVDIPPSEQFGKRQKMQDQEDPDKNSQLSVPTPPVPPNTETSAGMPIPDPLTAIRQEVFNNLGDGTEHAEELRGLTERLEQLESRANKQQQDLTALLKLVRQIANRQTELEKEKVPQRRQRGLFWPLIFVLLFLLAGSAGWLYWMNPEFIISISASLLNKGFDFLLNLIASAGVL